MQLIYKFIYKIIFFKTHVYSYLSIIFATNEDFVTPVTILHYWWIHIIFSILMHFKKKILWYFYILLENSFIDQIEERVRKL